MIAVDTSALMAIVLDEPMANDCAAVLAAEDHLLISAGTLAELLIVAARRGLRTEIDELIGEAGFEVVSVTPAAARRVGDAYAKWGRGAHAAALNFGDCFAYEVARQFGCRLLYVGEDFARTDIEGALGRGVSGRNRGLHEP